MFGSSGVSLYNLREVKITAKHKGVVAKWSPK
jgi:hypothetical protein